MKVTVHVDDWLWDQLNDRVKASETGSPGEWKKAISREIRSALQAYLGPDPKSVIHDLKRRERAGEPKVAAPAKPEEVPGVKLGMGDVRLPKRGERQ